jgi:hypothetical protein
VADGVREDLIERAAVGVDQVMRQSERRHGHLQRLSAVECVDAAPAVSIAFETA